MIVSLFNMLCMMASWILVAIGMSFTKLPEAIQPWIAVIIPFAVKNFEWGILISESHYTLPSSVYQVIAILVGHACYHLIVCIIMVLVMTALIWIAELGLQRDVHQLPDWMSMIVAGIAFVMTERVTSYFDPGLISEFLSSSPGFLTHMVMATLLHLAGYLVYIACMLALSYLVLFIAHGAIRNTFWWPELIHTSIVALTLMLLNMMWGSPFHKPSTDDHDMKSALVGFIYVASSMAVSYHFFGALLLLKTFVISLTFVLFNMFVKPSCSVSDIIAALVDLAGTIAMALLALFCLVALSFVVFMFLHTWTQVLLPTASPHYPARRFVSIVCLTFMAMKGMLGTIPVDKPSIFFEMKAGLLGIIYLINECHSTYVVIRNLTVVAMVLLSIGSRHIVSMFRFYTTAAFIVALGLVLTMPPGPGMPTENPALTLLSHDFVSSFVTSQFKSLDGTTKQLTDS